jgi:hypothetical protein
MNEQRIELNYTERVLPKWTSFLPVLGVFPAIWLTLLPINEAAGVIAGVVSTALIALVMIAKSAKISISAQSLAVATASIERKHISGVEVISKGEAFAARGRELDPRAWFHFQGSVETLVRVKISDPADPTPYWLFSTRRPEEVKKVLGF